MSLILNLHDMTDLGEAMNRSSLRLEVVLGELSKEKLDELTLRKSVEIRLLLGAGSLEANRLSIDWLRDWS